MPVRYEVDGPVAVVTIDRPDARNAVDRRTADAAMLREASSIRRTNPCLRSAS